MKKADLLNLLEQFSIKPSKKLGQNFLVDDNLLDFIVRTADIHENDKVIEVGPGLGVLTKKLVESAKEVIAVEFDSRLAEYIRTSITKDNFKLIESDALKVDFNALCSDNRDWRLIANLPYSITTPLLATFSEMNTPPTDMLFLLQKESADRFAAKPCSKEYGAITVKIQTIFDVKTVRTVSPGVFFPKPEVTSAIVKFTRKDSYPAREKLLKISKLAQLAFSHRRKKVVNNISAKYPAADVKSLFSEIGIDLNARAEQISVSDYSRLASMLG